MPSVVVTSAGLAALLNAEQNGTLPVKITKFGLGTGNYTPTADKTALQSKFKEITALSGGAVGDNVIHVTMTDASSDAYTANEVGVYLEDGTLFALSSQPVGAILQKAAGSQALLSLDLVLQGGTGGVTVSGGTNFFNPPATTTTAGVVKLASLDEITAGTNTTKACTPMGVWKFVKNYVASAIDSLKTLLRAEIATACLAAVPIGTMLPYAGGEVPEGFLLCNGASLSRTEYPELFAAIGDRWGSDSSSTFKLPDSHHRVFEGTTVLDEVGNYVEAGLRIFSVIQILQGTTTLRLLLVVLSAPVLDGHSLLCGNREQLQESLTLMLQDQTRFMGRQRQINLLHCVVICLFGINSE